jgi:hypothetical protein
MLPLQAHGEVLQAWATAQLRLAASQKGSSSTAADAAGAGAGVADGDADDTLRRLDVFLAANWQMYEEFAAEVLHRVRWLDSNSVLCGGGLCWYNRRVLLPIIYA